MRQTLFYIPHEFFDVPLFGVGWALAIWCIAGVIAVVRAVLRKELKNELTNIALVFGALGGLIVFVLPSLEARDFAGEPIGLPIRGYGTFLLFAFLSGVLLAAWRAQSAGLHPDTIYSLAMWMFVAGIVGARAFFVIEYWKDFQGANIVQTLGNVFKFTEGGLVVYGSLIGALAAFVAFCYRHKLPCLAVADVIAPSLALGLAIGRLGCLMNSCCFGGVCLEGPAIEFPQGSQPFVRQSQTGRLLGLKLESLNDDTPRRRVVEIEPDSPGARAGLKQGDIVMIRAPGAVWKEVEAKPDQPIPVIVVNTSDEREIRYTPADLPETSLPVHPTQLYSAFNALLLCLITLTFHPMRTRDGQTMALLLTLYPITRFLLELIRTDEPGQFGTAMTISQWVSIAVILIAAGIWAYARRNPSGSLANLEGLGVNRA